MKYDPHADASQKEMKLLPMAVTRSTKITSKATGDMTGWCGTLTSIKQ